MATNIEWTHQEGTKGESWNPTTGCDKVSQGCKNCYAEKMHNRLMAMGQKKYQNKFLGGVQTHEDTLRIPLKWNKPRTVFVNSMSDLFHKDVSFHFIDLVFAAMAIAWKHTFIIVTKRPDIAYQWFQHKDKSWMHDGMRGDQRIRYQTHHYFGKEVYADRWNWPLPNVWLLTSVEDQKTATQRIPWLLQCDAVIKGISAEPLLGPIDLTHIDADGPIGQHPNLCQINALTGRQTDMGRPCRDVAKLNWVITGGESGSNARPAHPLWIKSLRDQCKETNTPFFFKQWGSWSPDIDNVKGKVFGYFDNDEHFKKVSKFSSLPIIGEFPDYDKRVSMVKATKHHTGNELDGKQYLQFPVYEEDPF